jgi:hypothetical protein
MEFDTPGLCRLIAAYTDHNHFDQDLWDDVADSITYCNHYFAPMNCRWVVGARGRGGRGGGEVARSLAEADLLHSQAPHTTAVPSAFSPHPRWSWYHSAPSATPWLHPLCA